MRERSTRRSRSTSFLPDLVVLVVLVVATSGCGAPSRPPSLRASPLPKLPSPSSIDPDVRGAAYLTAVSHHLQPNWSQFLEDCRLRLPPAHALNAMTLSATATLVIDRHGRVIDIQIATSGNPDFDFAVRDVIADAPKVETPPIELLSDDDRVHVTWLFARDLRQAGPSTAVLGEVKLPLAQVSQRLLAQKELARAARRIAFASPTDPDRDAATELVMVEALREALGSGAGARRTAVEAIGRAKVRELAPAVRALVTPTTDTELRLAAITAVTALHDDAASAVIAEMLPNDLRYYPRLALAETEALVLLGRRDLAAEIILRTLESDPKTPMITALQAHAFAPSASLEPKLLGWAARGDARTRAAVCVAMTYVNTARIADAIFRGLRDPDATVRATCIDAVAHRQDNASNRFSRRLRELARDRDRTVRARALAELRVVDATFTSAASDPAPEVRVVAARWIDPALRLANDPDPEVRAAAVDKLGQLLLEYGGPTPVRSGTPEETRWIREGTELVRNAATDVAPQVRRVGAEMITDDEVLVRLASDDSPEVATAALVHLVGLRGRAASSASLLTQLAAAPTGSAERVRIALAWLLGR